MKLFVWSECLDTGAYHEDGSAAVIAESKEQAVELVRVAQPQGITSYHWASAIEDCPSKERPEYYEIDLPAETIPQVVILTVGCDC